MLHPDLNDLVTNEKKLKNCVAKVLLVAIIIGRRKHGPGSGTGAAGPRRIYAG